MKYQNKKTNEVLTYPELKVRYPLVSLAPFGSPVINIILKAKSKKKDIWNGITPMVRPEYDQYTEFVKEVAPVKYVQTWEVLKLADEQIISQSYLVLNLKPFALTTLPAFYQYLLTVPHLIKKSIHHFV